MHLFDFRFRVFLEQGQFERARDAEEAVFEFVSDIGAQIFDSGRFFSNPGEQGFEVAGNTDELVRLLSGKWYEVPSGVLFQSEVFDSFHDFPDGRKNSLGKEPSDRDYQHSQHEGAGQ